VRHAGKARADPDGAVGRAVAFPNLPAINTVNGREEEGAVDVCQVVRVRAYAAGVNVLDEDGAGLGAIALPQLVSVDTVVGREEQRPVHVGQVLGVGAIDVKFPSVIVIHGSWVDVLDEDGAGFGAVALPQLVASGRLKGGEEQGAVHVGQVGRIGAAAARID